MSGRSTEKIAALDSMTPWGRIAAVAYISGERYYFLINKHGTVSMLPADIVEAK